MGGCGATITRRRPRSATSGCPPMAALYDNILRRRSILSRQVLLGAVESACDAAEGGEPPRAPVLALFKEAMAKGRAEIRQRFEGEIETEAHLANDGPAVLAST